MPGPRANAIETIRTCIAADRFRVLPHFLERMRERGLVWADVLVVLDEPGSIAADGHDDWGRERWIIRGAAADGSAMSLVCVLGRDATGQLVVFVTAFWE